MYGPSLLPVGYLFGILAHAVITGKRDKAWHWVDGVLLGALGGGWRT